MRKKRLIFALLIVGALGISGYSIFQGNDQIVQADQTDKKQDDSENKEVSEQKREATKKVEKMTDEEIKELINKGKKANKGEVEVTEEETELLRSIPPEKYYDLMGMTDNEVLGYIDSYHLNINNMIRNIHKGKEDENEGLVGIVEFEWIKENYDFDNEYYNESINEILHLIDEYNEKGNQNILFSLKYILHELNHEFNPESLDEDIPSQLSIVDTVRIQNGKDPNSIVKVSH